MNKFTRALFLSVFIIGLLFSAHNVAQAASTSPKGCTATTNYSPLTGQKCPKGSVLGATTEITGSDETTNNPITTSLYPASGPVGTSVQISGSGFTPTDNTVNFGTTKIFGQTSMTACPSSNNAGGGSCITYITFTVPQNINNCNAVGTACTGLFGVVSPGSYPISVTNANGTSNSVNFTVTSDTSAPSITVLSPNGGETYQSGGKILVTWSTNNVSPTENLFVTLHRDADPNNSFYLTVGTPNDGKEEFVIPYDAAQGNYKLRIGSFSANIAQDYSDNMFSLTRDKNATYTLSVSSSYGSTGDMLITSPNNGIYCPLYNSSLPRPAFPGTCSKLFPMDTSLATQTVSLTVAPNQGSTFVKWTDDCSAYGSATQITFTMTSSMKCNALVTQNTTTSSITVLSPNGEEVYQTGQQMTIRWNSANTFEKKVSIGLVTPTGATYGIVNDTYDSGSYVWTIPSKLNIIGDGGSADVPFGKNFKIAISDDGSPRAYDISDNTFTINGKTISTDCTINTFTGGLVAAGGGTINGSALATLSWNTNCTNVGIENMDGFPVKNFGSSSSANTAITQTTTFTLYASNDSGCLGTKYSATTGQTCNYVKKSLTIKIGNNSSVSVVSPNGGEKLEIKASYPITYTSSGNVDIYLVKTVETSAPCPGTDGCSLVVPLAKNVNDSININNNLRTHMWTVGTDSTGNQIQQITGYESDYNQYRIKICSADSLNGCDHSDTLFAITKAAVVVVPVCPPTTPSITVLSPNGGEVYQAGQQVKVLWKSCNILGNISEINLIPQDMKFGTGMTFVKDIPNNGGYVVTLPTTADAASSYYSLGKNFKIQLVTVSGAMNDVIEDSSDNLFTINNGGETYPAGCTSALGYSPLTGISCTNPTTFLSGCTSAQGYSSTTGQPCNWTIVYPNVPQGCISNTGFSVTTGQPCDEGPLPTSCSVSGGPSVTVLSPNGAESYTPGQNIAVNWRTCRISRNTLMRLDLVMQKPNGGTLTRFLKTTLNDGTDNNVKLPTNVSWRQMVYGNNFKIRIRKTSSTTPQDSSDSNFSIATAIPASVTVSTDPTTPPAGTILVNNTANTNNVTIFKFQVKATGSDLNIRRIPILINSSSTPISAITNTIKLFRDGNIIDALDSTNGSYSNNTGGTSVGYIFSNISSPYGNVPDGTTASFAVAVDIKSLTGHYTEGENLTASFTNADVISTTNFSVQDANGDLLPSSQRSGSAQGQSQTLRTTCTNVVMGTTTITPTVEIGSGNISQLVYSIPIAVTACGGTSYIGQSAQLATTASGSNAFAYAFNVASNPSTPDTTSVASSTFSSSDAVTEGNGYRIDDGTTKHFTLTATLVTPSIQNSSYRVALEQIRTFTDGMLTTGATNINLIPPSSYQTPYAFINN